MSAYENDLPAYTNANFSEPTKHDNVYEDVLHSRRTSELHRNNGKAKSMKRDLGQWNMLLIISAASFVIALVAIGVSIGLFISVSNQVRQLQLSIEDQIYGINQDLDLKQQEFNELEKETEDQKQVILSLETDVSHQQQNFEILETDLERLENQHNEDFEQLQSDVSQQQNDISYLQNQTTSLEESITVTDQDLMIGYIILEDGWVTPFNGYKYAVTTSTNDWYGSYQTCNSMGSRLAYKGIRVMQTRRLLYDAFRWSYISFGLNDINSAGNWRWNSDTYGSYSGDWASDETALWDYGKPSGSSYDCVRMSYDGYSYNVACSNYHVALCEKAV